MDYWEEARMCADCLDEVTIRDLCSVLSDEQREWFLYYLMKPAQENVIIPNNFIAIRTINKLNRQEH